MCSFTILTKNNVIYFREGLLTSITKLVQKRVTASSSPRDDPDLEFNMKKVMLKFIGFCLLYIEMTC